MDFSKKVRFSLERLETREVPAQLGQIVELPYAAAPEAEVALTAPFDLGKGVEASIKIDAQSLNFTKIEFAKIKIDAGGSADLKLDPSQVGGESDPESAGKVRFHDIPITGKVQVQDLNFVNKVNKHTPM
jgi:hypothetical protein